MEKQKIETIKEMLQECGVDNESQLAKGMKTMLEELNLGIMTAMFVPKDVLNPDSRKTA